ncbi:MAG: short-chain fatty acyl-CoA regulator family protein [Pseudomonadota bacterium]
MRKDKLFIGPKLRRLRQSLGLTQTRMAQELEISPSYLNLIEGNQRPVSAALLIRLTQNYDVPLDELSGTNDVALVADLYEALRDPRLARAIPKSEVEAVVAASPAIAAAFLDLHKSPGRRGSDANATDPGAATGTAEKPNDRVDAVRRFIHESGNYFPALDEAAETLTHSIADDDARNFRPERLYGALRRRLETDHHLVTRIVPAHVMSEMLRYFDRHGRRINLSERLSAPGRCFQLAYQLAILEQSTIIDGLISESTLRDDESKRLARVTLANYFAAAMMMPYELFQKAAELNRYDVEVLSHRFLASFEQVAHRLTTLQRPEARGVPFFFIRIDIAGNISKRLSSGRFHFANQAGTCPLWNIHECFQTPGRIQTQIIQLPDERPHFSMARTVQRAGGSFSQPSQQLAVALGCDLKHAPRLVYADPYDLSAPSPVPIGPNCYVCERPNCAQRAHPPLDRLAHYDERKRGTAPVNFAPREQ